MLEINKIHHGECIELIKNIPTGSVDLILTDPPYGTMKGAGLDGWGGNKTDWDVVLDFNIIFNECSRILRKNGKLILFSQEPFTNELINKQIPALPFNYRLIWLKDHFANSLIAKKAPVIYFEDILVFTKNNPKHDSNGDNPLCEYFKEEKNKTGMTNRQLNFLFSNYFNKEGCRDRSVMEHYWQTSQFVIPTKEIYENILQKTGFFRRDYEELKKIDGEHKKSIRDKEDMINPNVFNLPGGKLFKSNIFSYKKDYNGFHPTQKPIELLKDLIKTYSNEKDLVLDFTCGSGSTNVACELTKRNYIGIEKELKYVEIANKRLSKKSLFQSYESSKPEVTQCTLLQNNSKEDGIPPTNKLVGILPKRL